jgi:hypothetical protein
VVLGLVTTPAFAAEISLGAGKVLNNTDSRLPGWMGSVGLSVPAGAVDYEARYTRLGKTQLGADAAISTLGATYPQGRVRYGLSAILGASYSPVVWWDKEHPHPCGVEGRGCEEWHPKRYDNDGVHYSRACHLCGGVVSVEYRLDNGLGMRLEYYDLRHMTPTFQGMTIQVTYTLGHTK